MNIHDVRRLRCSGLEGAPDADPDRIGNSRPLCGCKKEYKYSRMYEIRMNEWPMRTNTARQLFIMMFIRLLFLRPFPARTAA